MPTTLDAGLAGTHSFTLTNSFDQWNDHTKTATTTKSQAITFTVTVIDPAPVNVYPAETLWFYITAGGTSYSATNAGGFATPDLDTLQNSNKAIIDDALAKIKSVKSCTY